MKNFQSQWLSRSLGTVVLACAFTLCSAYSFGQNGLGIGTGGAADGGTADIPLLVSADGDVQGIVLVFDWDAGSATGVDLLPADGAGMALEDADLIQIRVEDSFMILAVVMDLDGQGAEALPAGQDVEIGTARIRCDGPATGSSQASLTLADDVYAFVDGGPLLANTITIEGHSVGAGEGLDLADGQLACEGASETETDCNNNLDDDLDGDTDCSDSDCSDSSACDPTGAEDIVFACGGPLDSDGNPGAEVAGPAESSQPVTFYYRSNEEIQGLSMSVKYHCDLHAVEDSFDITDGALDDVDAEFVFLDVDNLGPGNDGDKCGFTLGVLVDAMAPFDGRTIPQTASFEKLFTLDFWIEHDAACGTCLWIKFMDGGNGTSDISVKNLVAVDFFSEEPDELRNCTICVEGGNSSFVRGNCNFSDQGSMSVDIADAAAMVGFMFLNQFDAPCEDACDANDDGLLDAGDVVYLLNYLFVGGSSHPPSPGPTSAGNDPTEDTLGCAAGGSEC